MNTLLLLAEASQSGFLMIGAYIVIFGLIVYFFMIRPQKNEQKRMNALLSSLEPGDTVLTTAGFYGVIIDVDEDTVIVEFGNNKNCRIPMQKTSINQVEKPSDAVAE